MADYDSANANYQGNDEKDVYQDVEGDYIVNPIWPGLIKAQDAAKLLYDNFKEPDSTLFENGKENSDYKKIAEQVKKWKKKKDLKKYSVEVKIISVLPGKHNYSKVNYEVTFVKKYKDKSKKKEKLLYQDAVLHFVNKKQQIQTLGKCKLIKIKTSN